MDAPIKEYEFYCPFTKEECMAEKCALAVSSTVQGYVYFFCGLIADQKAPCVKAIPLRERVVTWFMKGTLG